MSASSRYCCQVDVKCRAADPVLAADIGHLRRFGFEDANFTRAIVANREDVVMVLIIRRGQLGNGGDRVRRRHQEALRAERERPAVGPDGQLLVGGIDRHLCCPRYSKRP